MRVGDLVRILNISEHTIRFYEKEGLITPKRDEKNHWIYSEEHVVWLEFILHMKRKGMSLNDLKQYKAHKEQALNMFAKSIFIGSF